ncbi:MAG: EAL and modified HD-GYP domain-containing signal transduction protein [Gammaproteobacteria bacterium]|jgi:EAL and modified HD-GYP domain-containing signal transduction protein
MSTALLARQPIYDVNINITAYELLFRSDDMNRANVIDGDSATSDVILNAFTELPIDEILNHKPAYINFTRNLLDSPPLIDNQQLVIEILEDIAVDSEMVLAVSRLKDQGYVIALDDYVYNPSHHLLLQLVDVVKIDILALGLDGAQQQIELLSQYNVTFLAEKVETQDEFRQCKTLGFTAFQGYFLSKPEIIKGKKISADQQSVLRLIAVLQDPKVDFDGISRAISANPALSFKLLRLVNSSFFNLRSTIDSITLAITMLGMSKIKSWAGLLAMTNSAAKPEALAVNTMIRSRMAQLLGEALEKMEFSTDRLFSAGLITSLDAYFDISLDEVMAVLSLPDDMREVILGYEGVPGLLLDTAILFERATLEKVDWEKLHAIGLSSKFVEESYIESVRWTDGYIAAIL